MKVFDFFLNFHWESFLSSNNKKLVFYIFLIYFLTQINSYYKKTFLLSTESRFNFKARELSKFASNT